jgi:ABC-type transporter Mla subunit MlaD
VVNQLFWQHRKPFDALLESGGKLRNAQAEQLAGRKADLRGALDAHRQALSTLASRAAGVLRDAGHSPGPDTIRRVTTTLEALAAYGGQPEAPQPGFLTSDVDPPGFEALAALVPRVGGAEEPAGAPPRVLPFRQQKPAARPSRKKLTPEEAERLAGEERRARQAAAKAAVQEAEKALRTARAEAGRAEALLKKAAAASRDVEKERADLEKRLEKATATADAARQEARRVASEAEDAAQALADAEAALENARKALKEND